MTDWAVGDLALCVDDVPIRRKHKQHPVRGVVYTVAGLGSYGQWMVGPAHRGLIVSEITSDNDDGAYAASRFRKIKPDAAEPCDPEFVAVHLSKQRVHCDGVGR